MGKGQNQPQTRLGGLLELLCWLIVVVGWALAATSGSRPLRGTLDWSLLHIIPFVGILVASYGAGYRLMPVAWVVGFALLCTAGFLPVLLPDHPDWYAIEMGTASIWFFVARTAAFAVAFAVISVHVALHGRRGRQAELARIHPICRRCEYDLIGNVSGKCPECGEETTDPIGPDSGD